MVRSHRAHIGVMEHAHEYTQHTHIGTEINVRMQINELLEELKLRAWSWIKAKATRRSRTKPRAVLK